MIPTHKIDAKDLKRNDQVLNAFGEWLIVDWTDGVHVTFHNRAHRIKLPARIRVAAPADSL